IYCITWRAGRQRAGRGVGCRPHPGLGRGVGPAAVLLGARGGTARPEALAEARGRGLVPPQAWGAGLVRRPWAGHGWPPGSGMAGPWDGLVEAGVAPHRGGGWAWHPGPGMAGP